MFENRSIQLLFGIYVRLAFLVVSILHYAAILIGQQFFLKEDRPRLWRLAVHRHNRMMLKIALIKLDLKTPVPDLDGSAIFATNHPSIFDGFVFFSLLGPDIIPVTAPAADFAFPFSRVFPKMGVIDIVRDKEDERKYKHSYSKKAGLEKIISILKDGQKVLIFPEGHLERIKELHYIHTGTARVSLRSKSRVVMAALVGLEKIVVDNIRLKPGTIQVYFGQAMEPPAISKHLPFRKVVIAFTKDIERELGRMLPASYIPDYVKRPGGDAIGVFIDIDKTLYRGYSQKDFLRFLLKRGKIPHLRFYKVFFYLLLEQCRLISHQTLSQRALFILRGYSAVKVEREAERFFNQKAVFRLNAHMLHIIKDHAEQGHHLVFVTETISPLARQFERYFKTYSSLDTTVHISGGKYTGQIARYCWGREKALLTQCYALEHHIDLKRSYGYADSFSDLPFLELLGHPIAVKPKKALKKIARERGWQILV